jgi:putative drug exporter of the RND superfamily
MATLLYRLGHLCVRRRRTVLVAWLALLVGVVVASAALDGETTDELSLPGTESQEAFDLIAERFPAQGGSSTRVVFASPAGATLADPAATAAIAETFEALAEVDGVSLATPPSPGAVSPDGRVTFGEVRYPQSFLEVEESTIDGVAAAVEPARDAGLAVEFGGEVVPGRTREPPSSEAFGLVVAMVILLVSFGSVLAMGLPILTALIGLGIGISGIGVLSAFTDLSSIAPTLAVMIGLAVGIDYALFIVTRHRQNIAGGMDVEESAARANGTAGGAVVFAGMTVVIAIAGLSVVGIPFLTVMALAAAATVAVAVLVAVTLLPALLGFAGRTIDRLRVPGLRSRTGGAEEGPTLGARWAARVTHHKIPSLVGGILVMALLAAPAASMRLGLPDDGVQPDSSTQRRAYDLLAEGFGPGFNAPLTIVVDLSTATGSATDALGAVREAVAGADGIMFANEPIVNPAGDTAILVAIPESGPADAETETLIHHLRDDIIPGVENARQVRVALTGSTATGIDISDTLADALPVFMVIVIGLIFLLMLLVFRSILIPVKAALAILVSIGSAFGVVVAIFQWGWLKDVVGLHETLPIISFLPLMMFAILFGLSMDYELFILSRVREEYVHTGDPHGAVLTGLTASARVITAAALIMVSVFGAFVLGDDPIIKMFGVGLSVAVLLDATIVRMVIVPAVLSLFGEKAWWLPGWLDRLLPNVDIEGVRLMEHLAQRGADQPGDAPDDEPALT